MKYMEITNLKNVLREKRDNMPNDLAIRLHRSVSWLLCAKNQENDWDLQSITLWIAFNACYGVDDEQDKTLNERKIFNRFIEKLVENDREAKIYNLLWFKFSGPVKALIKNRYLFQPFWNAQHEGLDQSGWEESFEKSNKAAFHFLANEQVSPLLSIVLDRLYVLRNQLMHGGATYQSKVNRDQVRDGCHMLLELMPCIIEIMMEADKEDWGDIYFPVV